MHIPDGFLDTRTALVSAAFAAAGVGMAVARARRKLPASRIPVLGLSAAFLFTAQMVNFPVAGGTSGHLVGGVLAAVLLGPSGAVIALTAVLVVQALLFADGGVLSLGANVLNIAVLAPLTGYAIYRGIARMLPGARGQLSAAGFASWCTILLSAVICSGELAWSGTAPWGAVLPAMVGVHAIIGLGEAVITMFVLSALLRVRPDLVYDRSSGAREGRGGILVYGAVVVLVVALFVVPFTSPWPDGLERVASTLGFSSRALAAPVVPALFGQYRIPGIESAGVTAGVAGAAGALVVLLITILLAIVLVPRADAGKASDPSGNS